MDKKKYYWIRGEQFAGAFVLGMSIMAIPTIGCWAILSIVISIFIITSAYINEATNNGSV